MEVQKFDFLECGGGQNDGPPASHIQDREFAECVNWYTYGQKLARRAGYTALTGGNGLDEALVTPFAYRDNNTDEFVLFAFTLTGLRRIEGSGYVALPRAEGGAFASSSTPWCVEQYRNIGYAARLGSGGLQRFTRDYIQGAGIDAPTTSPTLADGGAGSLGAGGYGGVVTFYNTETGAEGNPCAVSGTLSLGASKKIQWTGIPVPLIPGQITSRRLYRTLVDQSGEYFFVGQIDDVSTTTFLDNVVGANMGAPASFRNGTPPEAQIKYLRFWKERCWLATDDTVYFSEIGLPESFYGQSLIQVYPDDGSVIRALYGWGDRLVIGKTNLIAYLVGTDESDFSLQVLSEKHGIAAHHSVKSAEGNLLWFGGDAFYKSGGESPTAISTYKVRRVIEKIPPTQREEVYACLYPKRSWYLASIPQDDGSRVVVCYNYKTETFSVFEHFDAIAFLTEALDASGLETIYAVAANAAPTGYENNHVYQYDSGLTDRGQPIAASLRSKAHQFGKPGKLSAIELLRVLCGQVPETATISVYRDQETTPIRTRTVSLDIARPWKEYAISTRRTPGVLMQWGFEYSGRAHLEIDGFSIDALLTDHRGRRAA